MGGFGIVPNVFVPPESRKRLGEEPIGLEPEAGVV